MHPQTSFPSPGEHHSRSPAQKHPVTLHGVGKATSQPHYDPAWSGQSHLPAAGRGWQPPAHCQRAAALVSSLRFCKQTPSLGTKLQVPCRLGARAGRAGAGHAPPRGFLDVRRVVGRGRCSRAQPTCPWSYRALCQVGKRPSHGGGRKRTAPSPKQRQQTKRQRKKLQGRPGPGAGARLRLSTHHTARG